MWWALWTERSCPQNSSAEASTCNMMVFGDEPLWMIRSDEVIKEGPQDGISILIKRGNDQSALSLSLSLCHMGTPWRGAS